jgi:hypothetical protein
MLERVAPWWITAAYMLGIIPADFVMSRQMLRGVKARSERATAWDIHRAAGSMAPRWTSFH